MLMLLIRNAGSQSMFFFLSPQLEYKKGHEERVSKYTTFVDPPEVILAKKQGQIVSDVSIFKKIMMLKDIDFRSCLSLSRC